MTNTNNNTIDTTVIAETHQFTEALRLAKANIKIDMEKKYGLMFMQDHIQQTIFDALEYDIEYRETSEALIENIEAFANSLPDEAKVVAFAEILLAFNRPMSILLAEAYKAGVKDCNVYSEMLDGLNYLFNANCGDINIFAGLPHGNDC